MPISSGGQCGNSNTCTVSQRKPGGDSPKSPQTNQACSFTGATEHSPAVQQREPCDARVSRTVLRAAAGEIPAVDSPPHRPPRRLAHPNPPRPSRIHPTHLVGPDPNPPTQHPAPPTRTPQHPLTTPRGPIDDA